MHLRWLQDFLTVAERGNFTRAAEECNASQAAFSRRIQSLEAWLGVVLIDRGAFPTRLTPEGERFRERAAEIVRAALDARIDAGGGPAARRDEVRIAAPHALATGRLPAWWAEWSDGAALTCHMLVGNVHDTVTALVSGQADLLVCFQHAQQPIRLDGEQYECLTLGTERLRPYVAAGRADAWSLPGDAEHPVPLLMYSPGTYLGRMVDLVVQAATTPVGPHVLSSDMADVLGAMAAAGHGLAWLPDCTAEAAGPRLAAVGGERWSLTLSVAAYRDRSNGRPALRRLWAGLAGGQPPRDPSPRRRDRA